nr:MAG TPA: hypothetical protein [Caudoviricetes sp.]
MFWHTFGRDAMPLAHGSAAPLFSSQIPSLQAPHCPAVF